MEPIAGKQNKLIRISVRPMSCSNNFEDFYEKKKTNTSEKKKRGKRAIIELWEWDYLMGVIRTFFIKDITFVGNIFVCFFWYYFLSVGVITDETTRTKDKTKQRKA